MQDRPDKAALLGALAQFLMTEVGPRIGDRALGFRVLIAANLAHVCANEERLEDAHFRAELARLAALLGAPAADGAATAAGGPERRAAMVALNRTLADGVRTGAVAPDPGGAAWQHVKATLLEKLAVGNPRFDLRSDIEPSSPKE
jgi:hypothetical protein